MARTVYRFRKRFNVIGVNVRRLREQKNWSQRYLADRMQEYNLSLPKNAIQSLENGSRNAKDIEVIVLSRIFNVDVNELFDLTPYGLNADLQDKDRSIIKEISSENIISAGEYKPTSADYGVHEVAENPD